MPFVGQAMSASMFSDMSSRGFTGIRMIDFTNACGVGCQLSIVGKPFTTTDVGTVPGIGSGTGVGLTMSPAPIANIAFAVASGFGLVGPRTIDVCNAFAKALVSEASKITLTSFHTPVFLGSGTVVPGSIPVLDVEVASNITMLGSSYGFIGAFWPFLPQALSKGAALGFSTAAGSVSITGTFTGPTPPGPQPGVGSGFGTIS